MSDIEFDILYKVILVGDPAVGKTNILSRFTKDEFMEDTRSTVGVEFSTKLFEVGDHNIKVNIWDTAGQERFRSITLSYYKGSKGAIIVFDVSRRETFDHIEKWHKDIIENTEENISIVLVGNKCDLESREITTEEAQDKAKNLSKEFYYYYYFYLLSIIYYFFYKFCNFFLIVKFTFNFFRLCLY